MTLLHNKVSHLELLVLIKQFCSPFHLFLSQLLFFNHQFLWRGESWVEQYADTRTARAGGVSQLRDRVQHGWSSSRLALEAGPVQSQQQAAMTGPHLTPASTNDLTRMSDQALTRAMFSYQFKDHQCNLLKTQINSMFIKARICFIRPLQYQCLSIVHLNPVSMFNPIKVYIKLFNAMYFQHQWKHIFINFNRILSISCCDWCVYSCLPLIKP